MEKTKTPKRKKLKDYTKYFWEYDPTGKSKHQRNLKRCIYLSFTYKLEDNNIQYQTVGNTYKLIINDKLKVNPVEMTIQFVDDQTVYNFNSKVNLFKMVMDKSKNNTPNTETKIKESNYEI